MKRLIKACISFIYKIRFIRKCRIKASSSIILRGCKFEGNNYLGEHTYLSNTHMGYGSYMGYSNEFSNCRIGRFCSIGNNVRVVSADHPTKMVSTHPAFYSNSYRYSFVNDSKYKEHILTNNGYECCIGNDVWIGDNVLIKGGVTIGDGAVIAMGSIVLNDVEPFAIVGGVPARIIKKRFDQDTIEKLKEMQWWNKSIDWLKDNAESFEDPYQFLNLHNRKGNM